MSCSLHEKVKSFVSRYCSFETPFLLALSGGPDSLALYATLREIKEISFAVAHIDHGWREESGKEALTLQKLVEGDQIIFHLKTLNPQELKGNLEEECRQERLKFYKELCQRFGYQGVFLGHHMGDQAETVLKRLLEGAPLDKLGGILPVKELFGVCLLRPLLSVSKEKLIKYLEEKNLTPVEDYTNQDTRFLRARMRQTLIPKLEEEFGKNIQGNLTCLAKEFQELNGAVYELLTPYLQKKKKEIAGIRLDVDSAFPTSRFFLGQLIRAFCREEQVFLSRDQVDSAVTALEQNSVNKRFEKGNRVLIVDRGSLIIPNLGLKTNKMVCYNNI